MITYRDMTFCAASCARLECNRQITSVDRTLAQRLKLPFAMADFSATCSDYAEIGDDILRTDHIADMMEGGE